MSYTPVKATFNGIRRVERAEREAQVFFQRLQTNFRRSHQKLHDANTRVLERKLEEYEIHKALGKLSLQETMTQAASYTPRRKKVRTWKRQKESSVSVDDRLADAVMEGNNLAFPDQSFSWMERLDRLLASSVSLFPVGDDFSALSSSCSGLSCSTISENVIDIEGDRHDDTQNPARFTHTTAGQHIDSGKIIKSGVTGQGSSLSQPKGRASSVYLVRSSGLTQNQPHFEVTECWLGDPAAISSVRRPTMSLAQRTLQRYMMSSTLTASRRQTTPEVSDCKEDKGFVPPYPVHFKHKKHKRKARGRAQSNMATGRDYDTPVQPRVRLEDKTPSAHHLRSVSAPFTVSLSRSCAELASRGCLSIRDWSQNFKIETEFLPRPPGTKQPHFTQAIKQRRPRSCIPMSRSSVRGNISRKKGRPKSCPLPSTSTPENNDRTEDPSTRLKTATQLKQRAKENAGEGKGQTVSMVKLYL